MAKTKTKTKARKAARPIKKTAAKKAAKKSAKGLLVYSRKRRLFESGLMARPICAR